MAREPRSRKRCSWHLRKRERGYFKTRSAGVLNAPERTLSNPHIHRHSLPRLRGVRSLKEAPGTTALAPDRGRRRSPVSRQLHLCRTWKWPRVWSVNMHRAGQPSRRGRSGGAIVMARGCCRAGSWGRGRPHAPVPGRGPLKNTEFPQEALSWGLNGTVLRSLTAIQEKLN